MLDFLKKLIISNKYSLLVLLILSLWLKLAKDYSIILSYIVLIILYLIIGMIVGFVLDLLQENKKEKEYSDMEERPSRTAPRETKRPVSSAHDAIRNHSAGARTVQVTTTPRVTSSYIKSAAGVPSSVSRRLEKTAATFNSIKKDSDKYAAEEKKFSTLYGNTKKSLFDNPEELYKNKKPQKENKPLVASYDDIQIKKEDVKESSSFETSEFDDLSDFSTSAAEKTSDSEIDEISKEINERISQNTSTRHRKISPPKEISFVPKDNIRPAAPKSSPVVTSRPTNKVQEEPIAQKPAFETRPIEKPQPAVRRTHVVNDEPDDKVNADMEKLDRLFNHSRDNDDRAEKNRKNGLLSVFKKKRRAKRDKND